MKTALMCLFALVAFAANSILNRAALSWAEIGPAAFLSIRLIAGAVVLGLLLAINQPKQFARPDWRGVLSLFVYVAGFSFAYVSLDTGTGALILFGGVQITMFLGALLSGERPTRTRWLGSVLGLIGLAVLFLPGAAAPSLWGAALMIAAAIGWGCYSLLGKSSKAPLENTALNFIAAAPLGIGLWMLAPSEIPPTFLGISLAVGSGAIASGLGYAVWYAVLPRMEATLAAVAQLSVPIIAVLGGALLLAEPLTLQFSLAAFLTLSGVAIASMIRTRG